MDTPELKKDTLATPDAQNYASDPITSNALTPTTPVDFRNPNPVTPYPVASLDATPPVTMTAPETEADAVSKRLQELNQGLVGESAFRTSQENAQGLTDLNKIQTDLSARLKGLQNESLSIPLQVQNESVGRGRTVAGAGAIEAERLRNNAVASLSVASQLEQSRGNIATALAYVDRAVAQKYDPIREEIKAKIDNYNLIITSPAFTVAEKNRAASLKTQQDALARKIEKEAADAKEIYGTGLTALKYGADAATVALIQKAKTPEEAIQIGAKFLVDPKAKAELETTRIDNLYKQAQTAKLQKETRLLGEQTAAEKKAEREAFANAKTAIPVLQDKLDLIDGLIKSPGMAGTVGPYGISRWTPFSADKSDRVNFIAGVNQLTSQNTLDALLNLKKQGGTLGALSEGEGQMLRSAASKIGTWELKEDGKVYGYEASEEDFTKELKTIQTLTQRAIANASGDIMTADEKAFMDQAYPTNSAFTFAPAASFFPTSTSPTK